MSVDQVFDCCRVGPEHGHPQCEHWREFDKLMTIARCRWLLGQLADELVTELRSGGFRVTADLLASTMTIRVGLAKPRSLYVPWHLDDEIVEHLIRVVAAERGTDERRKQAAA